MNKYVLSVLVRNHSGVLRRVSGLFARRGYNIESLTVGVTENANLIINGGTIIVDEIASQGYDSGAGIGGLYDETSGNITIAGGIITIGQPSWWSAGIGGGGSGNCKDITITGSSTVITVAKGSLNDHYIGCSQSNGNVEGTITIGGGATVNGVKYYDHTGPL